MTLGKLHEQLHTVNKINYWADRDVRVQLFIEGVGNVKVWFIEADPKSNTMTVQLKPVRKRRTL